MFDVEKILRMTDDLKTFIREHDDLYLTAEIFWEDDFVLFRRLKICFRAILCDIPLYYNNMPVNEIFGIPVRKTSDVSKNFSRRTGIITIVRKPFPFYQTELAFAVKGQRLNVAIFVMNSDEVAAIYDRLTMIQLLQIYSADGFRIDSYEDIAVRFSRGMKTILDTNRTFKFQMLTPEQLNFRYEISDAAIVLQGPIVYEDNYTAETIKVYRKIYPNAPIVVSTWTDEATNDFRKICRENFVALLENKPPEFPGPNNANMQLESSLQGVKFVRENTVAKFVLKTRCDQRINKPDFLMWFRNLILTFPPFGDKLRGRILQPGAIKWLPFNARDFFAFGYVEDIFKLYGISRPSGKNDPVTYRQKHRQLFDKFKNVDEKCSMLNFVPPIATKKLLKANRAMKRMHDIESYIMRTFYEENIGAIDYDKFIETGWKFMREYLVLIGLDDVRLDWPKYETTWKYRTAGWLVNDIGYSRWLDLYRNFKVDWV